MNIGETRQCNEGPCSSSTSKFNNAAKTPSFGAKENARLLCSLIFNDPDFDDFSLDSLVRVELRAKKYYAPYEQSTKEVNGTPKSERPLNKDSSNGKASSMQNEATMYKCRNGDGDGLASVESSIINEREKLKETDEYKRAQEEEWASRKRALQIQAEEAQNQRQLRKRERAKSSRELDTERRIKQRLEEIRNSEKKNEEKMNLKEVMRAEIRKDLKKFELSCRNMASLLHCLGLGMGGWPNPSPHEVQTAYKRAILTFHPDRTSSTDIRKQVEAEEKFKLINRLKEKFPPF